MDAQNFLAAEEAIASNAWKVTVSPDGQAVTAPLHPYAEASSGAQIPWVKGMKFEAEIAVRLGSDLPVRRDGGYSRAEVVDAVATVHLGAELLVSAIEESGKVSFLLFLADRLGNSGYVLGPAVPKDADRHSERNAAQGHPATASRSTMLRRSTRRATCSPGSSTTPMTSCARRIR